MNLLLPRSYYFLVIWLVAILAYLIIRVVFKRLENSRIERINQSKFVNAIRNPFNVHHREKHLKRAQQGLVRRFSIIRISIVVLLVFVALLLSIIPFWNSLPTQFFSISAAVASIVLGIALKPLLENVIAGVVITMSRQFKTGDTVMIDDKYGTIEDINITHTTVKIWDWRRYVIPNNQMLVKETVNYTLHDDYLWAYVEFYVIPSADIGLVEEIAKQAVKESPEYWDSEEPVFWVMGLDKDAIKCWVASWAKNPQDGWIFQHQIRMNLIKLLKEHGILSHQKVVLLEQQD